MAKLYHHQWLEHWRPLRGNGISSLQDGMEIKPLTEAQYAEKLKKTEELGAAQGDLKELKKAFGK